ncbi:Protein aurora borealis [Sciurus carolinensis]|uniref:Protein aurora borealis n=1 Tax=Sciurus carolinensis TaxID=30640 RepID=A0AA41MES1_SCICA|nr:Protein aurora borealis [Sciurus carolinensis]
MGDVKELKMQITPETPGRIPVLNPFESPSDYSNLHEQTLASPSVFKSTKLPTPGKFRWSIDQLAVINPVEIDPEEIHRQASYLSHSRIDKDVEDKRQKAIEEFFTKDVIVPSPWTDHEGKQLSEYHTNKCININSDSPVGRKLSIHSEKSNDQKKFTFHSPDASSGTNSNGITNPCIRSPYIDGCSPIKNWSPMRLEMCRGGSQYRTSLIRIPFTLETHSEDEEDKDNVPSTEVSSPVIDAAEIHLQQLNSDNSTRGTHLVVTAMSITQNQSSVSEKELALLKDIESEENDTVDMVDPVETVDENTWIKEPVDNGSLPMTDFVSGIAFSIEHSQMCMSPLAESSVLPCENSNIQMDSGYNTQTCGSNIMDTIGTESYCKESDAQTFEVENKSQVFNTKVWRKYIWL